MIPGHNHYHVERQLRRMFTVGISDVKRRRLLVEVERCERCKKICRTFHSAEAALSSVGPAASPFAVERMADGIFAAQEKKPRKRFLSVLRLAVIGAAFSAVAVLLTVLFSGPSFRGWPAESDAAHTTELTARGGALAGSSDFGIRAFYVSKSDRHISEGPISQAGMLTFTYTRLPSGPGYLALFGVQDSEDVIWYYPDFGETKSVEIAGDVVDEPLGDGFNISRNHKSGRLLITALFSNEPMAVERIEQTVRAVRQKHRNLDEWSPNMWEALGANASAYMILTTIEDSNE